MKKPLTEYRNTVTGRGGSTPLPEMSRTDADTSYTLVLKGGRVQYLQPIDDPVFSAHIPLIVADPVQGQNVSVYRSDSIFSVIGCINQVRSVNTELRLF